jgi:hypothetical protein
MSGPAVTTESGGGKKRRTRLYTLGACLLIVVSLVALLASAVERVRDVADRAH